MYKKIKISCLVVFISFVLFSCKKEEFNPINDIIPEKILAEIEKQIPLYEGNTPPKIEGEYIISPCRILYTSYSSKSIDSLPDYTFTLSYQKTKNNNNFIKFVGDNQLLRIDSCDKACLVGSDNHFTAYYSIKGQHYSGITYKAALILSGTKASKGLENCYLTLVLLSKSANSSDTILMPQNSFRIINDGDNLVYNKDSLKTVSSINLQKNFLER